MKSTLTSLLILSSILTIANSYKILAVFPLPGRSHFDVFEPLLRNLIDRGHEVTVVSHFPRKTPLEGYHDVSIVDGSHLKYNDRNITHYSNPRRRYLTSYILAKLGWEHCNNGYSQKAFHELLNSGQRFDVILLEYFNTDCYLALAHVFKSPVIGLCSSMPLTWTNLRLGFPDNPAYVPEPLFGASDEMTFLERVGNTALYVFNCLMYKVFIDIPNNRIAKKYLGEDVPPLKKIAANTSLVLVNMHFSLNLPRPLPPGLIEVGGMNIGKSKNLPENLEKWISESAHGVVYFSLGSMIKLNSIPQEKIKVFLNALGRLPQRIIWKWEAEEMPNQPSNVMIQKWLPQRDILCHPNVKAYIAHGGLLGTNEAVYCGVPMVVLPQFGDQFTNAKALEKFGNGVTLDFWNLDEDRLFNAIKTVLNSSFQENAKQLSDRFKDRPMTAMDTAIYWVEYVIRHKGAHHLKTAAAGMPYYQYLLLDVIAFLLLIALVISYIFYLIIKAVFIKLITTSKFAQKLKKK